MGRPILDEDTSYPEYLEDDWQHDAYYPVDPEEHGAHPDDAFEMTKGYHGSSTDLRPSRNDEGAETVSAAMDRPYSDQEVNHRGYSSPWFVNYVTKSPGMFGSDEEAQEVAWSWAGQSANKEMEGHWSGADGRPRVYKGIGEYDNRPNGMDPNFVVPDSDQGDSPEDYLQTRKTIPMASESFTVHDTDWIPPGRPGKAIQGTLPHVNWNQFGKPNVGNPEDVEVGLTQDDYYRGEERRRDAAMASEAAEKAAKDAPWEATKRFREREQRSLDAGQMRLPGF